MKIKALQLPTLVLGNSLVFVVTFGLTTLFSSALEPLEVKTLDSRFQFRDFLQLNPSYSNSLVHINLDNYSKQASKVPVWPKTQYARIIDRIARGNAKVIACDVMFVSRADKHGDDELVDAFVTAGNVISPLLLDFSGTGSSFIPEELALDLNPPIAQGKAPLAYGILAAPMPRITEQSSGLGFVNIAPDADGIIRRVKLVADLSGTLVPSFFLQSLAAYLDYDIANIVPVSGSRLILKDFPTDINGTTQDLRVPLDGNGHMVVNLVGRLNTDIYHQSYSAWDLLQAEENPDFSGKLVFVADTSLQSNQSGDFSAVPLEKLFPRSYIFSTAASSILGQRFIRPTGTSVTFALALMLCGLLVLVCSRAGTLVFSVTALCVFTLYVAAVFGFFLFGGWVLPLLPVLVPLVAVYLFSNHWQRQQYRVFSFVDDLTGLHNRRWLNDLLPRQVSRASMSGESLSVGMIDIDHFKSFNDTYGHQAGDFVLAAVAKCLVDNLRPTDLSARYGGEEFTIIFPQTNIEGAITAAERMCKSVSLLNLVTPNGVNLPTITISIGVSELTANQHMDQLIEIADQALYEAKETGRNRVCKGTTEKVLPETEDN